MQGERGEGLLNPGIQAPCLGTIIDEKCRKCPATAYSRSPRLPEFASYSSSYGAILVQWNLLTGKVFMLHFRRLVYVAMQIKFGAKPSDDRSPWGNLFRDEPSIKHNFTNPLTIPGHAPGREEDNSV